MNKRKFSSELRGGLDFIFFMPIPYCLVADKLRESKLWVLFLKSVKFYSSRQLRQWWNPLILSGLLLFFQFEFILWHILSESSHEWSIFSAGIPWSPSSVRALVSVYPMAGDLY